MSVFGRGSVPTDSAVTLGRSTDRAPGRADWARTPPDRNETNRPPPIRDLPRGPV